jgi:hypothetical protein
MKIKWRCDVSCIVDKNWIPSGTREAVGIGQLHGVAACAYILGRWFITLFYNYWFFLNICVVCLIDIKRMKQMIKLSDYYKWELLVI